MDLTNHTIQKIKCKLKDYRYDNRITCYSIEKIANEIEE